MDPNSSRLLFSAAGKETTLQPGDFIQGGYFAGFLSYTRNGIATDALIVAPVNGGALGTAYPNGNGRIWANGVQPLFNSSPTNLEDGKTACQNITNSPAVNFCTNLVLNGYSDWYLPSLFEFAVAYVNLKPTTNNNSTSYGVNTISVPQRTSNYTISNPAQTTKALFQQGGQEAFDTAFHWTCSQFNDTRAYIFSPLSGIESDGLNGDTRPVRAFRRVPIASL